VFLLVSWTLTADEWVTGNGGHPSRDGLSAEHGPTAPVILWDTCPHSAVDGVAPVIGGSMVVSSRIESFNDIVHDTWIVAQDLETGAELWSVQLPVNFPDSWWSDVLAIRDGRVYATRAGNGNSNHEYLYALDPADGSIVWPSEALIDMGGAETPSFTSNGDLVIGQFNSILRIDHTDGSTMWETPRLTLADGDVAVFGNRVYSWEAIPGAGVLDFVVGVYDADDGHRLYGSLPLRSSPFGINQVGLFVASDGTVYAPMTNNTPGDALIALEDTGAALVEKWRFPLGYVPIATFGVGPDGSVYTYSEDLEVLRLDPADGHVRNTSIVLYSSDYLSPRIAVDARGRVFVTNTYDTLFAFDPDLRLRWAEFVPLVGYGGPAIGQDGTLVVTGSGTTVRAYRTPFSGDSPLRVDARTNASTVSDGNGVLEPGETALVEPSWENGTNADAALSGTSSNLGGPGSGSYTIGDAAADYGLVVAGSTANCFDATGACPRMTVSNPGVRPATHWDATFDETLSADTERTWTLHVGDSFPDVLRTDPFYSFVETILHNGVTAGCGGGSYCRNAGVTRAQMAVFLLRARHGDLLTPPPATGTVFEDVPAGSFAADWIEELAREGITGGCSSAPALYCPDAIVTRAQMAVFLLKTEHGKRFVPPPCAGVFSDVSCPEGFAVDWIEHLAAEGVTAGCGGGAYCPDNPNTRGQMAPFLVKTFGLQLYGP